MSHLYIWHSVPINKSSRPILFENEYSIYVKDGVGIYQGKLKIVNHQNGRVYLTNKRVIYIDSNDGSHAIAVSLKDVARAEYVERFLRSSPKVKVYLKIEDESTPVAGSSTNSPQDLLASLPLDKTVDWICVICSFNNHISTKTDLDVNFPRCISCGIPPSRSQIEQVIKNAYSQQKAPPEPQPSENTDQCPKCTFINHPSMRYCELCGTELPAAKLALSRKIQDLENHSTPNLWEQNPLGLILEEKEEYTNGRPYIKISFRKGGDLGFYEHIVEQIEKMKWEMLENRGGISGDATRIQKKEESGPKVKTGGIHSLERIGKLQRKQNEIILTQSLEDLEQLMFKAQDLIKLSSSFGSLVKRQKNVPTATIPPLVIGRSSSLFHQELARHISEYLLNSELTKVTSMITIPDLFASYNRFRILNQGFGTELITTQELNKSLEFLDKLQLPIKVTTFQSGLQVVTQRSHELQEDLHVKIMEYLVQEENDFKYQKYLSEFLANNDDYTRDKYRVFHGNTAAEIAEHFGWSHSVCLEEMDRCMDEQLVVFDKHILGTFYFVNQFDEKLAARVQDDDTVRGQAEKDALVQQKSISMFLKTQSDAEQNLIAVQSYDFGASQPEISHVFGGVQSEVLHSESLQPESLQRGGLQRESLSNGLQPESLSESLQPESHVSGRSPPSDTLGQLAGLKFT